MDSSFQRVLEESTPRTSLRQQLKVLPPQETPQVIKRSYNLRGTQDAKLEESAAKRTKGNSGAAGLHTQVLRRRSQLSKSLLDQSLNLSNIKAANQTYADVSLSASDNSSINESINLEIATRFRRKRAKPMESSSQPEFPTHGRQKKLPTGRSVEKMSTDLSFGTSPRKLRSDTSLASQTYADLSLLETDESSINASIDLQKATRFRNKRSKPMKSSSQPQMSTNVPIVKPSTDDDESYNLISSPEISDDSINLDGARNMRQRQKSTNIVLSSQPQMSTNVPIMKPPADGDESNNLISSPAVSDDSINLDGAGNLRQRQKSTNIILSQPNPSISPIVSPKRLKRTPSKLPAKWKSPEAFTSPRVKNNAESPMSMPASQPTPELEKTYDLDIDIDESLENVKAVTRQRFSRRAPAVKLNLSSLVKNLKKSRQEMVQEEDEGEVRQPSSGTLPRHVQEEEENGDNRGNEEEPEPVEVSSLLEEEDGIKVKTSLTGEIRSILMLDTSDEESDDALMERAQEPTVIPETQEFTVIPETQESTVIPETQESIVIPETQELETEPTSSPLDDSSSDHPDVGDDLLMKIIDTSPETLVSNVSVKTSFIKEPSSVENPSTDQLPPPFDFRDDEESNNNENKYRLGQINDEAVEDVNDALNSYQDEIFPEATQQENISPKRNSLQKTVSTPQSNRKSLQSPVPSNKSNVRSPQSEGVHNLSSTYPKRSLRNSPRKSVGMTSSVITPIKELDMVSANASPRKTLTMKSLQVYVEKMDQSLLKEAMASPKHTPTKTPESKARKKSLSLSVSDEGKSNMANQREQMKTVTVEAEMHPEEAIKAAMRAPHLEDESGTPSVAPQKANQSPVVDRTMDSNRDSTPLSRHRIAKYSPHLAQATLGNQSVQRTPKRREQDLSSTEEIRGHTDLVRDSIAEVNPNQDSEDSDNEEFMLPAVARRKSVAKKLIASPSPNGIHEESGVVSIDEAVAETSHASVYQEPHMTSNLVTDTPNTSKGPKAQNTTGAKQMTMKEFLQKLAEKPMQMPEHAKQGPQLSSLLNYTKPQMPKKTTVHRAAVQKKSKKELPKSLPKASTRDLFSHYAKCRLSSDGLDYLLKVSEEYWKHCCLDLVHFVAARKGRDEVNAKDVKKMMSRQGLISSKLELQSLIEKYLPAEERDHLIPTDYGNGQIYPLPDN